MRPILIEKSDYFSTPSYRELIDSMEYEVLKEEMLGSYQGDYLFFLKNGDRYGLLCFGYGSCSGCDSLEACNSESDVTSLRDSIHGDIKWFECKNDVLDFIEKTNTKAFKDWWYYDSEGQKFLDFVLEYCKPASVK